MNYALQAGDVVSVQYIGFVAAPGDANITEEFTGDGINNSFTLANTYAT
jgi:hypothetical protein